MSDNEQPISAEAAEKAYEAAAASAVAQADSPVPAIAEAAVEVPAVVEAVAVEAPVALEAPVAAEPAQSPLAFPAKAERAAAPGEAAPAKAPEPKSKPAAVKKAPKQAKPAKAVVPVAKPAAETTFTTKPVQFIKETIMPAKKTTADFIKTVKTTAADVQAKAKVLAADVQSKAKVAAADVQAKAKVAYAKGSEVAGEAAEFTKGNVGAVVASGKILGAGLQELGKTYAAEGKVTFETVTTDVKKISEVKSPVEFLQTQSAILRRNFDHAVEFNTKTGETLINLFGSAFAPLSARASLVVEKVKKAA